MHLENRRFHQVPVVWSIKHENENFRGGPYLSEYISTLFVACVQVKLSAVKARLMLLFTEVIRYSVSFLHNLKHWSSRIWQKGKITRRMWCLEWRKQFFMYNYNSIKQFFGIMDEYPLLQKLELQRSYSNFIL